MKKKLKEDKLADNLLQPSNNSHFFGHLLAEKTLLNAYLSGAMPQTWLISGPKSIGKATLAYRLARFVFANAKTNLESLKISADNIIFKQIASNNYPDLLVIDNSSSTGRDIKIEEIRKIQHFLSLTPNNANYRVVIIDSADDLNLNAANALLKILEEPPSNTLILLISHNPAGLLATISSRCCTLNLNMLDEETSANMLQQIFPKLNKQKSITLLDLANYVPGRAILFSNLNALKLYEELLAMMSGNIYAVHKFMDQNFRNNIDQELWFVICYLIDYFLSKLVKSALKIAGKEISILETELLDKFITNTSIDNLLSLYRVVQNQIQEINQFNLEQKQGLLMIIDLIRNKDKL